MTQPDNLAAAVLATSPSDTHDLDALVMATDLGAGDMPPGDDLAVAPPEIISPEAWSQQWATIHDLMGGMVMMRSGNPCPLGDQARSEGGQIAAQAAYSLLSSNPMLARLVLSPNASLWGSVMALGMHGFACVQIVKVSRAVAPPQEAQSDAV